MKSYKKFIDLFFVLFGGVIGAALGFLMQFILSKMLSASDYGIFSSNLTFVLTIVPVAILGFFQYWLNLFGEKGEVAWKEVDVTKKIVIVSSLLVLLAFLIYFYIYGDSNILIFYFSMGVYFLASIAIEFSLTSCQLNGKFKKFSFWQIFPYASRLIFIGIFFLISSRVDIFDLSYALLAASLSILFLAIFDFFKFNKSKFKLKNQLINKKASEYFDISKSFKKSMPYCLASILYVMYSQFGNLYIKNEIGSEYVGSFSIPLMILTGFSIVPNIIFQKFLLARIHYLSNNNFEEMKMVYKKSIFFVIALGFFISIILFFLSDYIFNVFYYGKYENANNVMILMSFIIPFRFLSECSGAFIATKNFMKYKTFAMFAAAVINIILCVVLGGKYGLMGVVYSLVFVEIFIAISYEYICRAHVMKSV